MPKEWGEQARDAIRAFRPVFERALADAKDAGDGTAESTAQTALNYIAEAERSGKFRGFAPHVLNDIARWALEICKRDAISGYRGPGGWSVRLPTERDVPHGYVGESKTQLPIGLCLQVIDRLWVIPSTVAQLKAQKQAALDWALAAGVFAEAQSESQWGKREIEGAILGWCFDQSAIAEAGYWVRRNSGRAKYFLPRRSVKPPSESSSSAWEFALELLIFELVTLGASKVIQAASLASRAIRAWREARRIRTVARAAEKAAQGLDAGSDIWKASRRAAAEYQKAINRARKLTQRARRAHRSAAQARIAAIDDQAKNHILHRHKYGANQPGAGEFPSWATPSDIFETVLDIANNPLSYPWGQIPKNLGGQPPTRYRIAHGIMHGPNGELRRIRVVVDPVRDRVVTAYPLGVFRHPH